MKSIQQRAVLAIIFGVLSLAALQIPFNKLAGSNVSFTLFDFFAPIAGSILGPVLGIATALVVEISHNLLNQTTWTNATFIRLFPVLFATLYFAYATKMRSSKFLLIIPILSIITFLSHPIGRQVPYYTLFWLIPLIAYKFRSNLFMRSLGATFTAHAVGGAMWIWAFNLPTNAWNALIPIVIVERAIFALGITITYLLSSKILMYLSKHKILSKLNLSSR